MNSHEVSLQDMLDARENRVFQQQKLLAQYKMTLISFTLNIPGPIKSFSLAEKAFNEGNELILNQLNRNKIKVEFTSVNTSKTGYEAFYVVDSDPFYIKKLMVNIENDCSLGRLFDIDVINQNNEKISRTDINSSNRLCLLCNEDAHVCSRSRKHSVEELMMKIVEIITTYFNNKFIDLCVSCAYRAMMYEVCTTPKPGLVDRANNGSHNDMDIYTFIDSSAVLMPYFREFVMSGIELHKEKPQFIFEKIRYIGMKAEDHMLKTTKNVNTHKGLIFSLGIICSALGYLYANNKKIESDNTLELTKIMTESVLDDFKYITKENAKTHGEKLFALHGITGIRGEASKGFISVISYGLPVLKKLINKGYSINHAGAITLINLIANVKDTNIVSRSSIKTQVDIQQELKDLIMKKNLENITMDDIIELDNNYIKRNISPGGCADLLAVTYMLYFIENEKIK